MCCGLQSVHHRVFPSQDTRQGEMEHKDQTEREKINNLFFARDYEWKAK